MKGYKELIDGFCKQLQFTINELYKDGNYKIKYPVEFKHNHYKVNNNGFVFEATINIERVVIFKEYMYYDDEAGKSDEAENTVFERLLSSTFCYGVMASKKQLEQFSNPPTNQ